MASPTQLAKNHVVSNPGPQPITESAFAKTVQKSASGKRGLWRYCFKVVRDSIEAKLKSIVLNDPELKDA